MSEPQNHSTASDPTGQQSIAVNKYDRPLATLDNNVLVAYFKVEANDPSRTPDEEEDAEGTRHLFKLQRAGSVRLMVGLSTALERQPAGERMDMPAFAAKLEALGIDRGDIFTAPRTIGFVKQGVEGVSFGIDLDTGHDMMNVLNWQIHAILFEGKKEKDAKNIEFDWWRFRASECQRRGIVGDELEALRELDGLRLHLYIPWSPDAPQQPTTPALDRLSAEQREHLKRTLTEIAERWMNNKNDALGLFNHVTHALNTSVPQHAVFVTSDKNFTKYRTAFKMTVREQLQALGFPGHIMKPCEAVAFFLKVTGASLTDATLS